MFTIRGGFFIPFLFLFIQLTPLSIFCQEKTGYHVLSVAFYNLENLYDIYDDPLIFDDDRTPNGKDKWTEEVYRKKIRNMAFAISQIGLKETRNAPVLLGVCEIENRQVLEDLVADPVLAPFDFGIIHKDSPDLRGIDVALLYQKESFLPENSEWHELKLFDPKEPDKRIYTRDQLVVSGKLEGEAIHLLINHWPSRSGGEKLSNPRREKAATLNKRIIDSLQRVDPYARIISMGDFNDDPTNSSILKVLGAKTTKKELQLKDLYNPMASIQAAGIGSLAYRDSWNLFDQIMISKPLVTEMGSGFRFFKASVFNEQFLTTPSGQFKGYPFRSFGNGGFTNGYSDHFPVYILLIRKKDLEPHVPGNPGENEN